MAELDEELDALFAAPLDEFVRLRSQRASALRKEGQRAMSSVVAEQTKPSVSAWVVNQLTRRRPDEVGRLLDVGARLREAHQSVLSGGPREELDDALQEERTLVAELMREAERILRDDGRAATAATLDRIRKTLRAAPTDEEGRELLARGRFVSDFEPTGFGALAGLKLPAAGGKQTRRAPERPAERPARTPATRRQDERAAVREARREARQALAAARDHERTLRRRLAAAEREAREAQARAARAASEVERLAAEADEAAEAVAAAAERLDALGST